MPSPQFIGTLSNPYADPQNIRANQSLAAQSGQALGQSMLQGAQFGNVIDQQKAAAEAAKVADMRANYQKMLEMRGKMPKGKSRDAVDAILDQHPGKPAGLPAGAHGAMPNEAESAGATAGAEAKAREAAKPGVLGMLKDEIPKRLLSRVMPTPYESQAQATTAKTRKDMATPKPSAGETELEKQRARIQAKREAGELTPKQERRLDALEAVMKQTLGSFWAEPEDKAAAVEAYMNAVDEMGGDTSATGTKQGDGRIRVKLKSSGQTGTVLESEFDPATMERVQ